MSTLQELETWKAYAERHWAWCVNNLAYDAVMRTDAYDMWAECVKAVLSHPDYVRTGTHIIGGTKRPQRRFRMFY
jgi:hypothetical protein